MSNQYSNSVTVFNVAVNGKLSLLAGSPFGFAGGFPSGIATNAAATFLFTANLDSRTVTSFSIAGNGALTLVGNFGTGLLGDSDLTSLAVFPGKSCSTFIFDICLQDDSNPGVVFLGNSQTGAYKFCCGGTVFTGVALVIRRGNTVTFQDNSPDRRVLVSDDESVHIASGSCGTITCSPASGSFFPKGTTTVTCTSSSGPSCTFTVTVVDTQPPTITCPANVPLVTDQNVCPSPACVVVTYPPPVASDNCPMVTAVCNPPSGSCFPVGVTTVTCTATDMSGNTATCSFTVTTFDVALQDDSNPAIILSWNSLTGAYRFCCNGVTYTGVGKATVQGCVFTLQHNPVDRRVLGRVDKAVHAGSGSIQAPAGTIRCTITDRNTLNDTLLPACQ